MTDEQITALRAAAEAATPGPWSRTTGKDAHLLREVCSEGQAGVAFCGTFSQQQAHADAAYIAAASPDVVLALLDALDDAHSSVRYALNQIDQAFIAHRADDLLKAGECLGSAEYVLRETIGLDGDQFAAPIDDALADDGAKLRGQ